MNDTKTKDIFLPFNLLRQYINALAINVQPENLPKKINLIFDSGAVNGIIGIGAALYIHHLEKLQYIKINKLSGCSIGSLIAVWYICGCPDTIYGDIDDLFSHYKTNKNFFIFEQIVRKVIHNLFLSDEAILRLNDILYINYYDTKHCKQRIVSTFTTREHLITCILRSSHIPFITNTCHKFDKRYVDGIAPYIFETDNTCKNLFVQLIHFTSPLASISIKSGEKNIYSRLIRGVVDANVFFINDDAAVSTICTYVNYKTKIQLHIRKTIIYFLLFLIELFVLIKQSIPAEFKKTGVYYNLVSFLNYVWLRMANIVIYTLEDLKWDKTH